MNLRLDAVPQEKGGMRRYREAFVIGLVLAVISVVSAGGHLLTFFSFPLVVVFGPGIVIATLLWWLGRLARLMPREGSGIRAFVILPESVFLNRLLLIAFLQFGGWLLGLWLHDIRLSNAQAYLEDLVPKLDSIRASSGSYPVSIDQLLEPKEDRPYLLKEVFYSADSTGFRFEFDDPFKFPFPADWHYSSRDSNWWYND